MKKKVLMAFTIFLNVYILIAGESSIRINSLGYLPKGSKKASVIKSCKSFEIIDIKDGKTVYSAEVSVPNYQKDVDQNVWIIDFTEFEKEGEYYIFIPGVGRSINFKIGNDVYNNAFYTAFRGLYLWRCGTAVECQYNGKIFKQKDCHLNDGYTDYISKKGEIKDGTGGWHDAGDYGKYVVNAGVSVGMLFNAWDHFNEKLKNISFDIPETAPEFPDYLEEIKWETDWLLKMQYPDGSGRVSHKLTRLNFSPFIMPEDDHERRFFSEWGTTATADFVAMMAMASRYFEPYNKNYAQECINAAKLSYSFLINNPDYKKFEQGDFHTGAYQSEDWDDRIWAAAEMWETTGETEYLKDFEKRISTLKFKSISDWDWQNVTNLGLFTYIQSDKEGKNPQIVENIRKDILIVADSIVTWANKDVYGRPLGDRYYWGCNGTVVRQVINLQLAFTLTNNDKYKNAALDAIAHVFGRNFYNRSYITGLGINPPKHPHDRRSGADSIDDPWPGYIVGGGHTATDWVDVEADYSHNEIALNWQAALIYALAWFVGN